MQCDSLFIKFYYLEYVVLLKNINLLELNISEYFNIFQLAVGGDTNRGHRRGRCPTGHYLIPKYNFNSTTRYLEQKKIWILFLKFIAMRKILIAINV